MKKTRLFKVYAACIIASLMQINTSAQDTIVQWTFPTEAGTADGGAIPSNLSQEIETAGGTSEIDFKNGATTKAARATAWDNGNDEKKWKIAFETSGYGHLKLSSKISAGGENPGPRDFKIQYKVGDGIWLDIENSSFQTANDWNTGAVSELVLPSVCNNKQLIKVRWIMTSDTATDGTIVTENGISKIDDIFITGEILNGQEEIELKSQIHIYPNPATDILQIKTITGIFIQLFDISGKLILNKNIMNEEKIDVSALQSGMYFLKINEIDTQAIISETVIIQ